MTSTPCKTRWCSAEIRAARQMPLKPVLETLGYRLEPRQNGNYRLLGIPAEVTVKDHYWVRSDPGGGAHPETASAGSAGNAVDFLVKIHGMTFAQAMRLLTS